MITACKYPKNVNTKEGKGTGWEQRNCSRVVLRRQYGEVEKRLQKAEKAQCPSRIVRCVLSSPAFVITLPPDPQKLLSNAGSEALLPRTSGRWCKGFSSLPESTMSPLL